MDLMEYMNINYKNMTELDVKIIFHHIANGIQYCHNNNIIHKDLKPENILVNVRYDRKVNEVKIADFGLACKLSTSLYRHRLLSTPGYEAPEILMGDINFTEKVDSYCLGVVLFNLITGKMPYKGDEPKVIEQTIKGDPKFVHKTFK